jgi:hypothetical protein
VTDQPTPDAALFVLWLDASDGSIATCDGVRWPDGTATVHHRHFAGMTSTHASPEAAAWAAHGKQARIVWPDPATDLGTPDGTANETGPSVGACGEECAEGHTHTGRCTQADPLPISTCPRTDRHGYHMWPDQPGPAFCPGHPAPDNARTTPDNPATSSDAPTCGYVKPHLPHQYMRLEVLGECPGVDAAGEGRACSAVTNCDGKCCKTSPKEASKATTYPHPDGDVTVLGPEIFASSDGAVISWRGENYVRQGEPAASDDGLRDRYAAAIRDATCNGNCGSSEEECIRERIQPGVYYHGILAEVSGTPEQFADAVMGVRDAELQQLRADMERYEENVIGELNETNTALARRAETAEAKLAEAKLAAIRDRRQGVPMRAHIALAEQASKDQAALARVRDVAADMHDITGARFWAGLLDTALDGPADTTPPAPARPACTATLRLGDTLHHCTRGTHSGAHSDQIHTWYDYAHGATPHCPDIKEP